MQYYLGAIIGCFLGGWAADHIGRINGLFFATIFAPIEGTLQAAPKVLVSSSLYIFSLAWE
jgi:outer membrane lipoprotein SlyB